MTEKKTFLDQYRNYLERVGKSSRTVRAYGDDVDSFATWFEQTTCEEFHPSLIDPHDIMEYRGFLLRQRKAPATINRRLDALRNFFRFCKREKQISDSPFELLENVYIKTQQDTAPRWLHPKEQLTLLRAVRKGGDVRDLAVIQTLLGTGLRVSELAALTTADLELSERKGVLHVRQGKGTKARDIPLDNQTRQALAAYLAQRQENGTSRLFVGQRGPLNSPGIQYLVAKYAYQTRLEACTVHTLRHTFAKNLVDAGTPLDQVTTLLGHENLDTTRVYTKPSQQDLERAVKRAAGEIIDTPERG